MKSSVGSCDESRGARQRGHVAHTMNQSRPVVYLHSTGCRTNQQEIASLSAEFIHAGYDIAVEPSVADIVVINTCCVTSVAEAKARRLVGQLARQAPRARICVTGCLAQHAPDALALGAQVDWVVANGHKADIPAIVQGKPSVHTGAPDSVPKAGTSSGGYRTRPAVKVQEGCDFRCSYCIVPLVRGNSRSVPLDEVRDACMGMWRGGAHEIVLTGTHIGQYRDGAGARLEHLLDEIVSSVPEVRLRLSSLDPRDLTDGLVDRICSSPRVCRHLHVSVQSLSEPVLEAMGRGGLAVDGLVGRLNQARLKCPELNLGADFIVGFPGETASQFDQTTAMAHRAGFTYGHVFRFSPRPSTPAARMAGRVSPSTMRARAGVLSALLARQCRAFLESMQGRRETVILERTNPSRGVSGNYIRVRLEDAGGEVGGRVAVVIGSPLDSGRDQCSAILDVRH